MNRDRWIQLGALGCMTAFLSASIALTGVVAASSGRNRLVYTDTAEAGDPPQVALGVAMGAFRGVFVNFLWIRANDLKEEGKYYEAIDLAKTITRLQPRFPRVWAFHAWNLAYNISVSTQTPQERWQWVQAGANLIRDEGIPANPSDLVLHKELAWIYLHKVQGYMDDAHGYYKRAFAMEWTVALGAPPKLTFEMRRTTDPVEVFVNDWLRPIEQADDSLEALYARMPAARELADRLRSDMGIEPDERLLQAVAEIKSFVTSTSITGLGPDVSGSPMLAIMADPKFGEAGTALVRCVRKTRLRDHYHMDISRMIRYTQKYGPMDWRHPASHAVYWSARGVEESLLRVTEENREDFDFVNTDRVTVQAVQELFRSGSLYFDILNPEFYRALPSSDFIDTYGAILKELQDRSKFDSEDRSYRFYSAGYDNFLRDAIRFLYRRGERERAQEYKDKLITWRGLNDNLVDLKDQLAMPLDDFVVLEITRDDRLTSPPVALQEIGGALMSAYLDGLLSGDDKLFLSNYDYALKFHQAYQKEQSFRTAIAGEQGRLGLPPIEVFAASVLAGACEEAGIPDGSIIYRRAPAQLQARAYVLLQQSEFRARLDAASAEAEKAGQQRPSFEVWFPPPNGWESYTREMLGDQPNAEDKGKIEAK